MSKASEIVLECIEKSGINQTDLANRIGMDRRNLNQMLHRGQSIKYEKLEEMLECMGYDIRLEKTDWIRVNWLMLTDIIENKKPQGKYWSVEDGIYRGVINEENGSRVKNMCLDKSNLFAWFDGKEA